MPLTQEQFRRAREAGYTTEDIVRFEQKRKAQVDVPEDTGLMTSKGERFGVFGSVPMEAYKSGERNVAANIFSRPASAVRSGLLNIGKEGGFLGGYKKGAVSAEAPSFQDVALDKYHKGITNIASKIKNPKQRKVFLELGTQAGYGVSTGGMIADIATNPADVLTMGIGKLAEGTKPLQALERFATKERQIPNISGKIRDYAGNKVDAIRPQMVKYWKDEVKAYGDKIESMVKDPQGIDPQSLFENATKQMIDRKLYDPIEGKWSKSLNRVDSQYVKSYETLVRKWKAGEEIKVGDIVREYQNIKNTAPIDSPLGREARNLANDFMKGIADQIDNATFKQANADYKVFRDTFDAVDKKIDVWGSPLETAKGESFLTKELGRSRENRLVAKEIEKKTGQSLKGAKTLSALNNLPGLNWIIRGPVR